MTGWQNRALTLMVDNVEELRVLRDSEASSLFRLVDSNRNYLRTWLPFVDRYQSVSVATEFIEDYKTRASRSEGLAFGIWLEKGLAGVITYDRIGQTGTALIGYWLGEKFQRKGLISKACRVLIDYVFYELKLDAVEIHCAEKNERCRAVPERLGFERVRIDRNDEWLYDHWVDSIVYRTQLEKWRATRKSVPR